jgi:hypothetical protein
MLVATRGELSVEGAGFPGRLVTLSMQEAT